MGGSVPGLSLASGGFQTIFGTPWFENALLQSLPSRSHGILPVQTSGSLSDSQPLPFKKKGYCHNCVGTYSNDLILIW